jgi:hypothetical protein
MGLGVEEWRSLWIEKRRTEDGVMAGIEGLFIPPRQCMLAASTLGQPVSLPQLQREGRLWRSCRASLDPRIVRYDFNQCDANPHCNPDLDSRLSMHAILDGLHGGVMSETGSDAIACAITPDFRSGLLLLSPDLMAIVRPIGSVLAYSRRVSLPSSRRTPYEFAFRRLQSLLMHPLRSHLSSELLGISAACQDYQLKSRHHILRRPWHMWSLFRHSSIHDKTLVTKEFWFPRMALPSARIHGFSPKLDRLRRNRTHIAACIKALHSVR